METVGTRVRANPPAVGGRGARDARQRPTRTGAFRSAGLPEVVRSADRAERRPGTHGPTGRCELRNGTVMAVHHCRPIPGMDAWTMTERSL